MYKIIHPLYTLAGHIICKIILFFCALRDKMIPPKENTVLFVAHPDDDTLFFHTKIKELKPYVVLMATGWSLKRLFDFIKVMKYYGVRFRAYDTNTKSKNVEVLFDKQVKSVLKLRKFDVCLTHNSEGEYGNNTHIRVHNSVISNVQCEIFVPVSAEHIKSYPLDNNTIEEKNKIFIDYYVTETFVIEEYKEWLEHEQLERYVPNE